MSLLRMILPKWQGCCKVASDGGLGVAMPPPKDLFLLVFGGEATKNQ